MKAAGALVELFFQSSIMENLACRDMLLLPGFFMIWGSRPVNECGVFAVGRFLACDDGHDVLVPCEAACFFQLSAFTDLVGLQGGSFISGNHQEAPIG